MVVVVPWYLQHLPIRYVGQFLTCCDVRGNSDRAVSRAGFRDRFPELRHDAVSAWRLAG